MEPPRHLPPHRRRKECSDILRLVSTLHSYLPINISPCTLLQRTRKTAPEADSVITAQRKTPFCTNLASSVHEIMPSRSLTCSLQQRTRNLALTQFEPYTAAVYKENSARSRFCDHCPAKNAVSHEFDEQCTGNHALTQFGLLTAAVYKTPTMPVVRSVSAQERASIRYRQPAKKRVAGRREMNSTGRSPDTKARITDHFCQ